MADPRLSVNWAGAHAQYMKFKASTGITFSATEDGGSAQCDLAVTISANAGLVTLVADGEFVLGKLIKVEQDLMCTVQVGGAMTLPGGTGPSATLTIGNKIVGDLATAAEGYIRIAAHGTTTEMILARGYIMNPATTTAVWVWL